MNIIPELRLAGEGTEDTFLESYRIEKKWVRFSHKVELMLFNM